MKNAAETAVLFKEKLGLKYEPVGIYPEDRMPENALSFKNKGNGCIAPLIFKAGSGKTVAIDFNSVGYPCSAFYMGYQEWIYPGIENFLSTGPCPGREPERLIETPEKAKEYVASLIPAGINNKVMVFRPVKDNTEKDPEAVILFVNPDQLSALTYLAHFDNPGSQERVVTQLASACASVVTMPLKFAAEGRLSAFWGMHDISCRTSFPSNILSFSLPLKFFIMMGNFVEKSFLSTERWQKTLDRIKLEEK